MRIFIYILLLIFTLFLVCDVVYVKSQAGNTYGEVEVQASYDILDLDSVLDELERMQTRFKYDQALLLLHDAKKHHAESWKFLLQRASVLIATGDNRMAISDLNKVLNEHPDNAEALAMRARYLHDMGKLEQSLLDVGKILAADPENGAGLLLRGMIEFSSSQYTEAIETFTQCLGKNTDSMLILYKRAQCYAELGDYDKARADLLIVVAESKGSAMADAAQKALQAWKKK